MTPAITIAQVPGSKGSGGSADRVGSNARFNFPNGIAIDGAGTLFRLGRWRGKHRPFCRTKQNHIQR